MRFASVVEKRNVLVWGPGRSGTTALAKLISRLGFSLDHDALNTNVLESSHLIGILKNGDQNLAFDYITGLCEKHANLVVKVPLLRAFPLLLERLSNNFAHIATLRNPLAIALRNYDYNTDFAPYYKSSIDECVRTEWTCRKLSTQGASVLTANYDILRAYPTESLVEAARVIGAPELTESAIKDIVMDLGASFASYNDRFPL